MLANIPLPILIFADFLINHFTNWKLLLLALLISVSKYRIDKLFLIGCYVANVLFNICVIIFAYRLFTDTPFVVGFICFINIIEILLKIAIISKLKTSY